MDVGSSAIRRALGSMAALAFLLVPACAHAAPPAGATPADRLAAAFTEVGSADAVRYDATDDLGAGLDGLKVIQSEGQNIGVYHHPTASGTIELYVATSPDLTTWTRRARLDSDASQGTIAAVPGGGYLVAYEWANIADIVPRSSVPALPALPKLPTLLQTTIDQLPRILLRLRYYPTLAALLAGTQSREFTAPRQLSKLAEGTPAFASVVANGGLDHSSIALGLHYYTDTDGDGYPERDRQATATLTNFKTWSSQANVPLNSALATTTDLHAGYTAPPAGNYGDRDYVTLDGAHLQVLEAQYVWNDFGSWRLFLGDRDTGALRALRVTMPGGSASLGNPTVTVVATPAGPALLMTAFVFGGPAGGEAVYLRRLTS